MAAAVMSSVQQRGDCEPVRLSSNRSSSRFGGKGSHIAGDVLNGAAEGSHPAVQLDQDCGQSDVAPSSAAQK
jgi:hypothetical protein